MSAPAKTEYGCEQDFALAVRAFAVMPLSMQQRVIEELARLEYSSATARFCDAVYIVIGEDAHCQVEGR